MATEEQIQKVINSLYAIPSCQECGARFRFGDIDCPHCGEDLEETLREWAIRLIDTIE